MNTLTVISLLFVLSGILSALVIALDLGRHRQSMRIMNSVWVLTGLWAGLPGLWAYFRFGRGPRREHAPSESESMAGMAAGDNRVGCNAAAGAGKTVSDTGRNDTMAGMAMPQRPHWQSVVLSTLHCGAGCTLADLLGEWTLFFFPVALAGSYLAASWVTDYLLALLLGVYFQYAAIRRMQRISRRRAAANALKADILSLTAWQAGMYAWMAVVIFALRDGAMFPRTSWTFWFTMQQAMYAGFLFSLPVNVWLIRKHIKHAM